MSARRGWAWGDLFGVGIGLLGVAGILGLALIGLLTIISQYLY